MTKKHSPFQMFSLVVLLIGCGGTEPNGEFAFAGVTIAGRVSRASVPIPGIGVRIDAFRTCTQEPNLPKPVNVTDSLGRYAEPLVSILASICALSSGHTSIVKGSPTA